MANLDFPSNPSNNDTYVINGTTYVYNSTKGYWRIQTATSLEDLTLTGSLTVAGTVDGRGVSVDGTKLDGIEVGATADQTKADIDALGIDAATLGGNAASYFTGYTDTAISNLVDTAPTTLDTLNELAAALGDDPNFATTVTNSISGKVAKSGDTMTGDLTVPNLIVAGNVDGRDVSVDGTKLDGIEAGAQVNVGTDLGNTATGTSFTITSSTGNNTNLPAATTSDWGMMTDNDKTKLDGIEASADVTDAGNVNPLIDAHLNTSTATSSQVLSWNGSDYDWADQSGGGGGDTGVTIKAQGTSTADTSAGAVDVTWASPSITGTSFTISGADLTCNVAGTYIFMFAVVINYANRAELTIQVELDTGSGYVAQAGEIMQDYVTRDADQDDGGVSMSTAFELNAGDKVKLTAVSVIDSAGTAALVPNGTRVVIMSPKGAAGAQGPAGETWVALTQAQYDALTPVSTTLYLITG
ncbi:hypothetical protein OAD61_00755 [bacterium]|nr:hypothetical protein [bacterium]